MGYFCLPQGDDVLDDVEAAIANIELYLQSPGDYRYLLDTFALPMLETVVVKLKQCAEDS